MQIALEVIENARTGDAGAFNHVVLAYRKKVLGTVARLIGRPEDAEDVTQEVFTRLYFTFEKLREPELFEFWLRRMTINAAYSYLRNPRRQREPRMGDLPESHLVMADAAAGRRADAEEQHYQRIRDQVEDVLAGVSDADRILLILKEVEGLSHQELEQIYQVSQNALKVRIFRARHRVLRAFRAREARKSRAGCGRVSSAIMKSSSSSCAP